MKKMGLCLSMIPRNGSATNKANPCFKIIPSYIFTKIVGYILFLPHQGLHWRPPDWQWPRRLHAWSTCWCWCTWPRCRRTWESCSPAAGRCRSRSGGQWSCKRGSFVKLIRCKRASSNYKERGGRGGAGRSIEAEVWPGLSRNWAAYICFPDGWRQSSRQSTLHAKLSTLNWWTAGRDQVRWPSRLPSPQPCSHTIPHT